MQDPYKSWMKWELRYMAFIVIVAVVCLLIIVIVVEVAKGW